MGETQWRSIRSQLPSLAKTINFSSRFLSVFLIRKAISPSEVHFIESLTGNLAKTSTLFDLLQRSEDGLSELTEALEITDQKKTLELLEEVLKSKTEPKVLMSKEVQMSCPEVDSIQSSPTHDFRNLVVGDKDCRIEEIIKALSQAPTFHLLENDIFKLFRVLDIPEMDRLEWKARREMPDFTDTLDRVLSTWRSQKSYRATLSELINALKMCRLNDLADSLTKYFSIKISATGDIRQCKIEMLEHQN